MEHNNSLPRSSSKDDDNNNHKKEALIRRSESWNNANKLNFEVKFSKNSIFDTGMIVPVAKIGSKWREEVDDYREDSLEIKNCGKKKLIYKFNYEPSPKFELVIEPASGVISKDESVIVHFRLRIFCTTTIRTAIEVSISEKQKKKLFRSHSTSLEAQGVPIHIRVKSEPSRVLDYDEISIEKKNLASGAFGVISRGKWRGIDVCVKTISTICSDDERKALEQEINVLERVHCPYIVTYIGATRIEGQPVCLVMQYEKEGSLDLLLAKKEFLSDKLKAKIMLDAARGVSHLHMNNIYHMDLKPGNMVLTSLEENATVNAKLIDFDLAQFYVDDDIYAKVEKGIQFGSMMYAPPEALAKEKTWKASTYDSYSFGVCLWEVFSEQKLYHGMPNHEIIQYVTSGKRPDISVIKIPKLRQLIEECWDQHRKNRPDFNKIVNDLESIFNALPRSTTTPKEPPKENSNGKPAFPLLNEDISLIGWAGDISRSQAVDLLKGKNYPRGTFLFRYSEKAKSFVLSFLTKDNQVEHIGFITRGASGDIVVNKENNVAVHYPTLYAYAVDMRSEGIITTPIPIQDSESTYEKTPTRKSSLQRADSAKQNERR